MHHTSKCLTDMGQSFVSLCEVQLSSSSEKKRRLSLSLSLSFGVWSFSLFLPDTPGPLAGCLGSSSLTVVGGVKGPVQAGRRCGERESCHGR